MQNSIPSSFSETLKQANVLEASAQRAEALQLYNKVLNENLDILVQAFEAGTPVDDIVHARAQLMDMMLNDIWEIYFPNQPTDIALLAVGGYGRGELHPKSDIDIMVLIEPHCLESYKTNIEGFVTLLWDLGLEIGHSVRTTEDCSIEASKDVTVVTNLMECRLLAGPESLYERMKTVIAESSIWSKEDFFNAKLEEQKNRHSKFHDTAFRLEPNIKEAPGGLRDIQTIAWVAKRYFDAEDLNALTRLGFLTIGELDELLQGREFLWRVRFALHTLTGRREDRLLFEHQRELAKTLGYNDEDQNLAVEQFMQTYYRTVMGLERLGEMLLQLLQEAIEYPPDETVRPKIINDHFQTTHGYLEVRDENVFEKNPSALLEVFLLKQRMPEIKGVRASTIRLIRSHCKLINDDFRNDIKNRNLFMDMLKEPRGISHEFQRMNRYGVLASYLPEFENIVGRMQFDLFHIYTVDQHTILVLRNVRSFSVPEHAHEHPLCSKIFHTLPNPEVLYIAALYHDIAKGRGGDHSELGAIDAEKFCKHHGMNTNNVHTVKWLIESHLLMSITAQRKDISDPNIIQEFANAVGDQNTLDYLYLLTVADINATNPELWTSWRDQLLFELYIRTKRALRNDMSKPINIKQQVEDRKKIAIELLQKTNIKEAAYQKIWSNFNDDYFLRHNGEEITWHTQAIAETPENALPLIAINTNSLRGSTPIFIYTYENDDFFALTSMTLSRLGLNVVDARIVTTESGYALDTYMVLDRDNRPISDQHRVDEIHEALTNCLNNPDSPPELNYKPLPRKLKEFNTPTKIDITDKDPNTPYTSLEIIALDRPGLLGHIGQAFLECDVRIHNAKIGNVGENAENIFIISDENNQPLSQDNIDALSTMLHKYIDHDENVDTLTH